MRSCKLAHFGGQVGLVAHGRGHAAQQRGNLRACLREAEDVVDEQQRVRAFDVAEVLGHGQRAQGHAQARSGRLGHLPVDQRALRVGPVARLDDAGLGHLEPKVVALAGTLAHAGKHREAAVILGHVIDQFHDDDGLAHARAAEQADLAALQERLDQVDDLDAGLEHLLVRGLLVEQRRRPVNGHARLLADGSKLVHRLADHVDDAAQRLFAHGHANRAAEVDGLHAANHAVGSFHGHGAHAALAQMLLNLENHRDGRGHGKALAGDAQRLVDGRHRRFFKLHVHRGTGDLNYFADVLCHFFFASGAEAPNISNPFAARLKPYPDTKPVFFRIPARLKPCPFKIRCWTSPGLKPNFKLSLIQGPEDPCSLRMPR